MSVAATGAAPSTSHVTERAVLGSVPTIAAQRRGRRRVWMMSSVSARTAAQRSPSIVTPPPAPVPVRVVQPYVYNLTVGGAHEFYADGVLVHNCDALRYLLMQLVRGGHDRTTPGMAKTVDKPITAGVGSQHF